MRHENLHPIFRDLVNNMRTSFGQQHTATGKALPPSPPVPLDALRARTAASVAEATLAEVRKRRLEADEKAALTENYPGECESDA